MSLGGLLGSVVGGTIGFFIGGPFGAAVGAGIGGGVGMYIDPIMPDTSAPGGPQMDEFDITTAKEGLPIPDILGTTKVSGNIIWYCCERSEEVTQEVETGGSGGGSEEVVVGYEYYLTWATVLCLGPVDTVFTIYSNDTCVWHGLLNRPLTGGKETLTLDELGEIDFYFGTDDQEASAEMAAEEGEDITSPLKGVCYVVFKDCMIGSYPRAPMVRFVLGKWPQLDFNSNEVVSIYDYNPAHAIYYIKTEMMGLPSSFLNDSSFSDTADTLKSEGRGISMLFSRQQSAMTYIESLLAHVNGIIRYSSDEFCMSLLRQDEDSEDLPSIDENMLLDEPTLSRGSWLGTISEQKIQYSRRVTLTDEEEECECACFDSVMSLTLLDGTPVSLEDLVPTTTIWCEPVPAYCCDYVWTLEQGGGYFIDPITEEHALSVVGDKVKFVIGYPDQGDYVCGGGNDVISFRAFAGEGICDQYTIPITWGACGSASIIYTTQAMALGETQVLRIEGVGRGCTGTLVIGSGGGTLEEVVENDTYLYTAPETNPNCDLNPSIELTVPGPDGLMICDTLDIAIRGSSGGVAYTTVTSVECQGSPSKACYEKFNSYGCNDGFILFNARPCGPDGVWIACEDAGDCGYPCRSAGTVVDSRSPEQLALGCCPVALL